MMSLVTLTSETAGECWVKNLEIINIKKNFFFFFLVLLKVQEINCVKAGDKSGVKGRIHIHLYTYRYTHTHTHIHMHNT